MEMNVTFTGNLKVETQFKGFSVLTDQPESAGGDGEAPSPFDLFLASLATCAGIFMLSFMKQRGIDASGSGITMTTHPDPDTRMIGRVVFDLRLPDGFPERYEQAIIRSVELCSVKRHLHDPPEFDVLTSRASG